MQQSPLSKQKENPFGPLTVNRKERFAMESMLLPKYFDILIVDDIPEHIDVAVQVLRDKQFQNPGCNGRKYRAEAYISAETGSYSF